MQRCEEIFRQICWLEERFWPDVDGMGEEDDAAQVSSASLGPMGAGMDNMNGNRLSNGISNGMGNGMAGPTMNNMSGNMNTNMGGNMNNNMSGNLNMNSSNINGAMNNTMTTPMRPAGMSSAVMTSTGMNGPGQNSENNTPVTENRNVFGQLPNSAGVNSVDSD